VISTARRDLIPRKVGAWYASVLAITAFPILASSVENLADLALMTPIDFSQLKKLVQRLPTTEILPQRFKFHSPLMGVCIREFFDPTRSYI
jgi:hypothetical protein